MKKVYALLAVLVLSLSVITVYGVHQQSVQGDDLREHQPGSYAVPMAPAFTLQNYDGTEVSLSSLKGKVVVLEWFNDQCPFVKYHNTENTMKGLADKYAGQDVVWLAVNSSHFADNAYNKKAAESWSLKYPILNDSTGEVGKLYSAKTTPHMYIIDKEGQLVYQGAIDNKPMGRGSKKLVNYVDQALGELLSGKSISNPKTKPYGCSVKYAK